MRQLKTWIIVADGSRARFLSMGIGGDSAVTMPEHVFESHAPPTHDLGNSKPGRSFESVGGARHTIESRVDLHENMELAFLKQVVDHLREALKVGALDRFVLVAPPKALGHLRDLFDADLNHTKFVDIALDLTKHTDAEIAEIVKHKIDDGDTAKTFGIEPLER
jgi:protein required for attachment to host cells